MPESLTVDQLSELRVALERVQDELLGQLERISEDSKPVQLDQQSVGRLSRMDAMQQQQMASANGAHMKAHLNRVRLALGAMDKDEFGDCRKCDEPIGFARLQIRPDSPLCMACQQSNEL